MKEVKKFIFDYKYEIILVVILLLAAMLRFYNVPNRYTFDGDATPDAIVAYKSVEEIQLPLTGNFSAAGAFTFGPWYYYHLILFEALTHLPFSVWLFNGVYSLLTVVVMYFIGKELKDRLLGIFLAFLTAITPAQIAIASSSSNPNIVVFYTALAVLSFIKLSQNKNKYAFYWALALGSSMGIAINAHYQAFPLVFFLVAILFAIKSHRVTTFILSMTAFFITFLPLLFFNLTNHWHTLGNFIYYTLYGKNAIYVPNSWTIYVRDFWPYLLTEFFGIPYLVMIVLGALVGSTIAYLLFRKKVSRTVYLLLLFAFLSFVYLRYFWGERHTVYLYFLHPFIYIFTGYALYFLSKNRWGIFLSVMALIVLSFFGLRQDLSYIQSKSYKTYSDQVKYIKTHYKNDITAVYICDNIHFTHAMALNFLLYRPNQKTEEPKIKLAIGGGNCPLPNNTASSEEIHIIDQPFAGYDFSVASSAALVEAGWRKIDTDEVYKGEVRWYFTEQP